jgi:rhodanese-related sulfurtransferase
MNWKSLFARVWPKMLQARTEPGHVTEASRLEDIAALYPNFYDFLRRRYAVTKPSHSRMTLGKLVEQYCLPSAQIVFMEMQLEERSQRVRSLGARDVAQRLASDEWRIVDVREPWEHRFGSLPQANAMDSALWDRMVSEWDKQTPILLYCHFGIRSLDAANQLLDQGFTNVHVLQGGIDAWSLEVDPSLARYEGSWC